MVGTACLVQTLALLLRSQLKGVERGRQPGNRVRTCQFVLTEIAVRRGFNPGYGCLGQRLPWHLIGVVGAEIARPHDEDLIAHLCLGRARVDRVDPL